MSVLPQMQEKLHYGVSYLVSSDRQHGIIIALNLYNGTKRHPVETIAEVLWNTGRSWILQSRVKVISESW